MLRLQSEAPGLHLERAGDREGGSRISWCADYWQGECPALGWWWRDSQKSNKPSKPPEILKNVEKEGGFMHFLAYKSPKMPFFAQKYLTRYNLQTFFEEYMNFKIVLYLSHCEVIPVQRFSPQPPGLGLRFPFHQYILLPVCKNKYVYIAALYYQSIKPDFHRSSLSVLPGKINMYSYCIYQEK